MLGHKTGEDGPWDHIVFTVFAVISWPVGREIPGLTDHEPVAGGACMSPQVLQGERKAVQGTILCLHWLIMVVWLSFLRLEFEVWVSALTLSLLCVGECRLCLADWELDPELHWNRPDPSFQT